MKKSILALFLVMNGLASNAQVDLTINPFFLLIPGVQVSLEFNTKKDWGFGGDVYAGEDAYAFYLSSRHFFSPNKGGDRFNMGAFAGGAGGGGSSGAGLGFFIGYKAVSVQKIVFDIAIGGGRDFTDDIGFLPYFKANVGYRFGLKETD